MSGEEPIKARTLAAFIEEQEQRGAYLWTNHDAMIGGKHPRYLYGDRTTVEMPDEADDFVLTPALQRHLLVRLWPDDFPSG